MKTNKQKLLCLLQLCLSGLSDRCRLQASTAILSMSLPVEDILNIGGQAQPVRLHGNKDDLLQDEKPNEVKNCFWSCIAFMAEQANSILNPLNKM